MKIIINGGTADNYLEALRQIQIFLTQVKKHDELAVLHPWLDSSQQPTISSPQDIPGTEDDAEDYFYGLNPRDDREGTQTLWFKLRIGLSITLRDL